MPSPSKKQKTKKASGVRKGRKSQKIDEQPEADTQLNEPTLEYTTKIRAIGNSKGVILNNQVMDRAGLATDSDIVIQVINGLITIKPVAKPAINTDLSTWDKQIKAAIKAGAEPEGDLFEGLQNEFDKKEW